MIKTSNEILNKKGKISHYIEGIPRDKLVLILCKVCGKVCYATVSKFPWRLIDINKDSELYATCRTCSSQDRDKNNWISICWTILLGIYEYI